MLVQRKPQAIVENPVPMHDTDYRASRPTALASGVSLAGAIASYRRHQRARNLSDVTVALGEAELTKFAKYLGEQGMPEDVAAIRREHIESYLLHQQDR